MNILGVSCYYHDSAAVLLQDGVVVAAAEEERLSRRKHDRGFPSRAIDFCCRRAGVARGDLDYVVFYEKPLVKLERTLQTSLSGFPRSWKLFREALVSWAFDRLWIKGRLMETLGVPAAKTLFVDHHLSHAASAFFCSPFTESAILTVDGVGEWATATMGTANGDWNEGGNNSIHITHELRFPHSLGLLYSVFTAFLGFEVNEGEYKVMGMAPYGRARYLDRVHQVAEVASDGSLWLDMDYFCFHESASRSFTRRFVELFGEPRTPESPFITPGTHPGACESDEQVRRSMHYADVAASIQAFTEEVLLKMATALHRRTGLTKLCMAGGVALNSVANGRILRETPFDDIFIQPAAGDSGGALGATLYVWHVLLNQPRRFAMEHAYLGDDYTDAAISDYLRDEGIAHENYPDENALVSRMVDDLQVGKVIGWFQGRFEWGPRALGNRSILADPRRAHMKDLVNEKIKFREPFRPFAPVIPEPCATQWFDDMPQKRPYPERFMLPVYPWKPAARDKIPAVDHMGTGRLQTIRPEWNSRYHQIVSSFGQATGVPVLMNTSFNLRGEPIVASPADAMNTFRNSGIDVLVLGNCVVRK